VTGRRQFLAVLAAAGGLGGIAVWATGRSAPEATTIRRFPIEKSDAEWRAALTAEQYHVLREHATERAFSSPLDNEKRVGTFVCAACRNPLFSSKTKFDSGTGWPSFWEPLPSAVGTSVDHSWLMTRTEVHCAKCGGHLGHVFPDGPRPTGLRYCMNGDAMIFLPAATSAREGRGIQL
jgi:peptide-methionine (R)-S-oxide reductase